MANNDGGNCKQLQDEQKQRSDDIAEAEALKSKGNAEFVSKNYENAKIYYSDAISLDPSNHVLFGNRSAAYLACGQYEDALEDAETAVSLKSDWVKSSNLDLRCNEQGHYRKALALEAMERYREAQHCFQEVIRLDARNSSSVLRNLHRVRRTADGHDRTKPITSTEQWLAVYQHLYEIRDRLGPLVYFWNESTLEERRTIFLRFFSIVSGDGATIGENDFPATDMRPLPLQNYAGFEMPQSWLKFYLSLPVYEKVDLLEKTYALTSDQEKTMIINDLKFFVQEHGGQDVEAEKCERREATQQDDNNREEVPEQEHRQPSPCDSKILVSVKSSSGPEIDAESRKDVMIDNNDQEEREGEIMN